MNPSAAAAAGSLAQGGEERLMFGAGGGPAAGVCISLENLVQLPIQKRRPLRTQYREVSDAGSDAEWAPVSAPAGAPYSVSVNEVDATAVGIFLMQKIVEMQIAVPGTEGMKPG
jgi:hypothetical protein